MSSNPHASVDKPSSGLLNKIITAHEMQRITGITLCGKGHFEKSLLLNDRHAYPLHFYAYAKICYFKIHWLTFIVDIKPIKMDI